MAKRKNTRSRKTQEKKPSLFGIKGGSSIAIAGGAMAGAALGAAAVAALTNKNTKKMLGTLSTDAANVIESADRHAYTMHHKATKQLHKATKAAKKSDEKAN